MERKYRDIKFIRVACFALLLLPIQHFHANIISFNGLDSIVNIRFFFFIGNACRVTKLDVDQ